MELAAPLAEAKRAERGEAALNDIDRRHLRRAASHIADCPLLQPQRLSPLSAQAATPASLQECARTLAGRGVALFAIDLTRPEIGVAAARVVSPQLQPYAAGVVTDRLRQCRAEHGRLHEATAAIPLL
jgi:ribosomal protein S12 methylthiotransferase accessory factor